MSLEVLTYLFFGIAMMIAALGKLYKLNEGYIFKKGEHTHNAGVILGCIIAAATWPLVVVVHLFRRLINSNATS